MNKPDVSKCQVVRKNLLEAPHYTLSFRDQLYLSASSCSALGTPRYVKLHYGMEGQTITVMKATSNDVMLRKEEQSSLNIVIGTVKSSHRIGGVRKLQRLIQQNMKTRYHFRVLGFLEDDCLVFDLRHAFYRATRAAP